jgi:hypothetical protein
MRVEYVHTGAGDAPLLRLFNFTRADLADLIAAFRTLAATGIDLRLAPGEFLTGLNLRTLNARSSDEDLGIVPQEQDGFDWVLTPESWRVVADRAGALIPSDPRAFQWLDESSSISVLLSQTGEW